MKFAAGVTLYNPTVKQISQIETLTESFEVIFLFDNSEPWYKKPEYPQSGKFHVISENENKGLSYAFNCIIDRCNGYDYLCTLDQDSMFEAEDIKSIQKYIETLTYRKDIGIVAPFIDYGYKSYQVSDVSEVKKWVITSGAFVNLAAVRQENLRYDENYFIDRFEVDLCFQLRSRGYTIQMYHGSTLHQRLGEETARGKTSHNAIRHYYLFRNRYYFNNKWYNGLTKWFLNITQIIKHLYIILFYETELPKKLKAFIEATKDYMVGRMGKKIYNR